MRHFSKFLKSRFLIFLVSYEPKYTQVDQTRQLTSTNISLLYIYRQCYMNNDLNLAVFHE